MFGMTRNPAESYAKVSVDAAIEGADPHRLILMLFDGAIVAVVAAQRHMAAGEIADKGVNISKAIGIITNGLKASLDVASGGDLAERLSALYDYMAERLLWANAHNQQAPLEDVLTLLRGLRDAWAEIAPQKQAAA